MRDVLDEKSLDCESWDVFGLEVEVIFEYDSERRTEVGVR